MKLEFHCFGEVRNSRIVGGSLTLIPMLGLCSAVNKIVSACIIMYYIHKKLFLTSVYGVLQLMIN